MSVQVTISCLARLVSCLLSLLTLHRTRLALIYVGACRGSGRNGTEHSSAFTHQKDRSKLTLSAPSLALQDMQSIPMGGERVKDRFFMYSLDICCSLLRRVDSVGGQMYPVNMCCTCFSVLASLPISQAIQSHLLSISELLIV